MPDQPTQIGPYRITEPLGREGAATVYRAVGPSQNEEVRVHLLSSRFVEQPAALERFQREGNALSRFPHPNLLQVVATGREGDRPYLVTEAFDGVPLDEVLRSRRLSLPEAIHVMKGICRGLAQAHMHGVVHRHVWPHAIRVSPDLAQVKLTDFGFLRVESLGTTGTIKTGAISLAAFHYLAPEQTDGRPDNDDHRADLYSAGVVFQEMLTGRAPGGRVALPSQLNSEFPAAIDVLVLKCLARNPTERYATAIDLLAGIGKLEEASQIRLITGLGGIGQPASRRRALLAGGLVLLLVLLAVVGYLITR